VSGFQQIVVVGNVGRSVELRYTDAAKAVADFSLAVNRKWKSQDGETHEEVVWFKCTAWGQLAETVNAFVRKGQQVTVIGRIAASSYLRQDGTPAATLELTATQIVLPQKGSNGASAEAESESTEIPFA
jgi:single-strand DNA-binding protein